MRNIYILNEQEAPVGILNPELPDGCPFFEDTLTEKLEHGYLTFEFEVPGNHPTASHLKAGGFIIYPNDNYNPYLLRIMETTETNSSGEYRKKVYCENAAVSDLLGNIVRPAELKSYTLEQAVNYVLNGTGWTCGNVEFAGNKDIKFDDYVSSLEALHQVLDTFGAEITFTVEFDGLKIRRKTVSGVIEKGSKIMKPFVYGLDLTEVERVEDYTNLVTALIGVGNADNSNITFMGYTPPNLDTEKYEKPAGADWVGSLEALQRWGKNGKHIMGVFKDDKAQNAVELFNNTLKALDEYSKPRLTYKVGVVLLSELLGLEAHKVQLGDTVIIKDTTFQPELILEARIIEVKRSITDKTKDEITLGEFIPILSDSSNKMDDIRNRIDESIKAVMGTGLHINANAPKPLIDGDFRQYKHSMFVEVTENIHIGHVSVFCETAGQSGIVELRLEDNTVVDRKEFTNLSAGENRLLLDFLLKKDVSKYMLYGEFSGNTWRTTQGLEYPYYSGTFKVTGSTSSESYWYHFYDISIGGSGVKGAYGRELKLGNTNNQYGSVEVFNAAGETAFTITDDIVATDTLVAGEVIAPNVANVLRLGEGKSYFVDAVNGSDENDGLAQDRAFATFQRAIDVLPRILDDNVNFNIESDLTENITISGFLGRGTIYVNAYPYKITGTVKVDSCKVRVDFATTDFYRVDGEQTAVVQVYKSDYVYFNICRFFGKSGTGGTSATVAVYDNSFAYFNNCEFYGAVRENIRSAYGARTMVYNCRGGDSAYGVFASYAGLIGVRGTVPNASSPADTEFGGQVVSDTTITGNNGTLPTPTTPPKISTWYSSSGNSWRTKYNGWRNDGTVRQGQYGGYGLHTGLWLWGSGVSDAITGKNITRARVYLTRNANGGNAANQTVYIRWHSYLSYPSGQPAMSSDYVTASFRWGASRWVALPTSFINAFKAGTAKGIGIYSPTGSYMIFDDTARLEFTYS